MSQQGHRIMHTQPGQLEGALGSLHLGLVVPGPLPHPWLGSAGQGSAPGDAVLHGSTLEAPGLLWGPKVCNVFMIQGVCGDRRQARQTEALWMG